MTLNHSFFEGSIKDNCLYLKSPAKMNLSLRVVGKRSDGYHFLHSLMVPIELFDRIYVVTHVPEYNIICKHPDVPEDESNLALQAAMVFFNELGKKVDTQFGKVAIYLEKQIPVGAGLGGGSSNAATVLLGLNRHFGNPFSLNTLLKMGIGLGADVPFFIYNQPAIATGIGEIVQPYDKLDPYKVLLVYPGYGISTATVYKKLNLGLTNCKKKNNYLFSTDEKFCPNQHLCNDLESVAFVLCPELCKIKMRLIELGACGALMSGSGSSIFGLFDNSTVVQKAYKVLSQNKKWQIHLTDLMLKQNMI
jgi:4-diphosphocytidyl-2-C-methyl-D-erythritol kinase